MKNALLILLIILATSSFTKAISRKDTIKVEYSFWGNSYFIDTVEYSKGEISDILSKNQVSSDLISSLKTYETFALISLLAGGLLTAKIFYDINVNYNNYGHGPTDNAFYYTIGAAIGLDVISIFLFSSSKGKFKRAIKSYNKFIIENSTTYNNEFNLNIKYNRIMFSYSF